MTLGNRQLATITYSAHDGSAVRDRETVIGLWHGNLGHAGNHEAKFNWFYLACPWGSPLVQLLRHDPSDIWIGTCAAGPRRMLWQGREIRAGILADFAVDPRHRTLGPAIILQSALMAAAVGRFDLLYGFPNRKSLPVVKRLGYVELGEIPRFSRVLRYRDYIARIIPDLVARPLAWLFDHANSLRERWQRRRHPQLSSHWSDRVDPRMDALWEHSPHGERLIGIRDTIFLRWRFDESSTLPTRYLLVCDDTGETLLAWFACQEKDGTLHVRDFWSLDAATGVRKAHIDALIHRSRVGGYKTISLEYSGAPASLAGWADAGFRQRSSRPIIGYWPSNGTDPAPYIHFTAADEDE